MKALAKRGMAPGMEVTRHLSRSACWRSTLNTRPDTRIYPWTHWSELGIPLGFREGSLIPSRFQRVSATFEDVVLVVAGPRLFKTLLASVQVAYAPGAVVATSTRFDIHKNTVEYRRHLPIHALNPEGMGGIESGVRFSPIPGSRNPQTAMLHAGLWLEDQATAGGNGDSVFWEGNSYTVLRCLFRAADYAGLDMHAVVGWVKDLSTKQPADILRKHGCDDWAEDYEACVDRPGMEKATGSVSMTLRLAFEFMSDPVLAQAVCPETPDCQFDVDAFVREGGTLYILGTKPNKGSMGPLFACLTGAVYEAGKRLAGETGRLDPPMLFVLDEAYSICKVPLAQWTSDMGGRGMPCVLYFQSFHQLVEGWGEKAAGIIRDNAGLTLVGGGGMTSKSYEDLSTLIGSRFERSESNSGDRKTISAHKVPVLTPDQLRVPGDFRATAVARKAGAVPIRVDVIFKHKPPKQKVAKP